jgi:hypothetical protein
MQRPAIHTGRASIQHAAGNQVAEPRCPPARVAPSIHPELTMQTRVRSAVGLRRSVPSVMVDAAQKLQPCLGSWGQDSKSRDSTKARHRAARSRNVPCGTLPCPPDSRAFGNAAGGSATARNESESACTMIVDSTNTPHYCTGQDATISSSCVRARCSNRPDGTQTHHVSYHTLN